MSEATNAGRRAHQSRIGLFLLWCCGADPDMIGTERYLGIAERRWYHSLGASVIVTGVLAAGAMEWLVHAAYPHARINAVLLTVACALWGMAIFNVDRIIVSRVLLDPSRWGKLFLAGTRTALALLIAVLVAVGVEMTLFKSEIQQQVTLDNTRAQKNLLDAQKDAFDAALARHQPELTAITDHVKALQGIVKDLDGLAKTAGLEQLCENRPDEAAKNGVKCETGTGNPGSGQQSTEANDRAKKARDKADAAHTALEDYTTKKQPRSAFAKLSADDLRSCNFQNRATLTQQEIDWCGVYHEVNVEVAKSAPPAAQPSDNGLLRRLSALSEVANGPNSRTIWTLRALLFLILALFDLVPLSAKMIGGATQHDTNVRRTFQRRERHFLDKDLPGFRFAGIGWGVAAQASEARRRYYQSLFDLQLTDSLQKNKPRSEDTDAPDGASGTAGSGPMQPPSATSASTQQWWRTGTVLPLPSVHQEGTESAGRRTYQAPSDATDQDGPAGERLEAHKRSFETTRAEIRPGTVLTPTVPGENLDGLSYEVLAKVDTNSLSTGRYQLWKVRDDLGAVWVAKCGQGTSAHAGLERDTTAALSKHENIIAVQPQVFRDERTSTDFVIMPYYPAGDLDGFRRRNSLTLPQMLDLTRQIMLGMVQAHSLKLAHRDLKPHNILIDERDRKLVAVITDFGISKYLDAERYVATDSFIGTLPYAPLEQILVDNRPYGRGGYTTDLWAIAAVLYEMITDHPPRYVAEVEAQINTGVDLDGADYRQWLAVEKPTARPLDQFQSLGIPAELSDLVARWLSNDPRKRVAAADIDDKDAVMPEAIAALDAVIGSLYPEPDEDVA